MSILKYFLEAIDLNDMTVYHGTNQDFDKFTHDVKGITKKGYTSHRGFWFTTSHEEAVQYAKYSDTMNISNSEYHERKMESYISQIENAQNAQNWDLAEKLTSEMEDYDLEEDDDYALVYTAKISLDNPYVHSGGIIGGKQDTIIDTALTNGYDSVIFKNIKDSPYGLDEPTTQIVVFDSKNIRMVDKEEV